MDNETMEQAKERWRAAVTPIRDIPSGEVEAFDRDRSAKRAAAMSSDSALGMKLTTVEVWRVLNWVVTAALAIAALYFGLSGRVDNGVTKQDAQYAAVIAKIEAVQATATFQAEAQKLRDEQSSKDTAWLKGQVTMQGIDIRNIQIALAKKGFEINSQ